MVLQTENNSIKTQAVIVRKSVHGEVAIQAQLYYEQESSLMVRYLILMVKEFLHC